MIGFACLQCHKRFQVEDKLGGRKTKCPNCNAPISIPVAVASHSSAQATTKAVPNRSPQSPANPTQAPSTVGAVRGAVGYGVPSSSAKPPSHIATAEDEPSGLSVATKVVAGVGGVVCMITIGFLVWFVAIRDTWELHNVPQMSIRLDEADRLQKSDPLKAYKTYDEVLKEAEQHKVTDEQFLKKLAKAEKSRTALYQKVQEQIRAEEAEKQRQAEEEARRAAEEQRRVAQQQERKRAAEEAHKIAEEKSRAEEKRREEAVSAYRNAPQSARNALGVVKKVEARTEVGINYRDYSTVVGEAWGDVKVFAESPEGKAVPEFSVLLVSAMAKHKLAVDVWRGKFGNSNLRFDEELSDIVLRECWRAARYRLKVAGSLVSIDDVAAGLSRAAILRKVDETYEATIRSLFPELVLAHLNRKLAKLKPDDPKTRADFEGRVKKIGETLKTLMLQDSQEP